MFQNGKMASTRALEPLSFAKHVSYAAPFFPLILVMIGYYAISAEETWKVNSNNYKLYTFPKVDPEIVPTKYFLVWIFLTIFLLPLIDYVCVRHSNKKLRIISGLNVAFGMLEAFLYNVAFTEFGKKWVTEPRPDFVDRCTGSITAMPTFDSDGVIICTRTIKEDAYLSFPSGHSSCSFAAGVFLTAYFIWLAYFRKVDTPWRRKNGEWIGKLSILWGDFAYMLAIWPLIVALYIAASRVVDHRHSPADVVTGSFIGTLFGLAVFARVVARVGVMEKTYMMMDVSSGSKFHRTNTDTTESVPNNRETEENSSDSDAAVF
eukprot:m.24896 g.24896  ORF g.24896 m.24896 type:complete len:319 (-) comp5706_c0_seq1:2532-3488(-)